MQPVVVIFTSLAVFQTIGAADAASGRRVRFCISMRTAVCDNYALIAAMSGWEPMMFITRVRL